MSIYDRFAGKIALGDKVRITKRLLGTLYQNPSHDTEVEGKLGIVYMVQPRRWPSGRDRAPNFWVRMLEGERPGTTVIVEGDCHDNDMELHEKGDGTCVPGKHFPFTEDELRNQRYEALVAKVQAHDLTHEGFVNPATFLAHTYLNNERAFHAELPSLRRKDGTINPLKVLAAFNRLRLVIDAWAYQCPVELPAEFAGHSIRGLASLTRVDWQEVADQFKAGA